MDLVHSREEGPSIKPAGTSHLFPTHSIRKKGASAVDYSGDVRMDGDSPFARDADVLPNEESLIRAGEAVSLPNNTDLLTVLKEHFGFDSFRDGERQIW